MKGESEIITSIYKEFKSERVDTLSFRIELALIGPVQPSEAGFRGSLVIFLT